MSTSENPIHLPRKIADPLQDFTRSILLGLSRYNVKIEGSLPTSPSLLLAYPHNEHANSILLPPSEVSYVAASDYFFKSIWMRLILSTVVDTLPITRYSPSREKLYEEILLQQQMLEQRKKHVLVYPQGTRIGQAQSSEKLREQIKPGALLMAQQLGVGAYPVGFVYPRNYQPSKDGRDAWKEVKKALSRGQLPPERDITVRIGEPLEVPDSTSKADREAFARDTAHALWTLVHGEPKGTRANHKTILERMHLR